MVREALCSEVPSADGEDLKIFFHVYAFTSPIVISIFLQEYFAFELLYMCVSNQCTTYRL
jgi:hypothetical protein